MVAESVCAGDALDGQVLGALKPFPTMFVLSMLPDVTALSDEVSLANANQEDALEKVQAEEWRAKLRIFELHLEEDQRLLGKIADGHDVLQDALHFLQCQKRLKQAETAEKLVDLYQQRKVPTISIVELADLPGKLSEVSFPEA